MARLLAELERERGSELTTDELAALVPVQDWSDMLLRAVVDGHARFAS